MSPLEGLEAQQILRSKVDGGTKILGAGTLYACFLSYDYHLPPHLLPAGFRGRGASLGLDLYLGSWLLDYHEEAWGWLTRLPGYPPRPSQPWTNLYHRGGCLLLHSPL